MKLFNTFIALKRITQTHKDIAVPMSAKKSEIPLMGEVVYFDESLSNIAVGETLVFLEYASHVVDIKGEEFIFVKQEDVIAKFNNHEPEQVKESGGQGVEGHPNPQDQVQES